MIFTFYSYKGGVGRSMAMAGVAYLLAQRGLRVLAMDFDLEAPGLERYFFDGERCRTVREQPGLLDLILDYRAALASKAVYERGDFKNWQRYCTPAIHAAGSDRGSVDLMTAGRREPETAMRDYALAVRSFDWQDFFHNAKGDLFFDWLRRRLTEANTGYDVVLVDSRTGVTEMGGVCAYQLADVAVLLCAANHQNLEGTRDVARDFRSEGVRALRPGRPLEIVVVPARIETGHPDRQKFLARFRDELGVDGLPMELADAGINYESLAIPYLPEFAVAEHLVGEIRSSASRQVASVAAFERLADALTLLAPKESKLGRQRKAALSRLRGESSDERTESLADASRGSAGFDAFIEFEPADEEWVQSIGDVLDEAGYRTYSHHKVRASMAKYNAADHALEYSQTLWVCFGAPAEGEDRARLIARARRLQNVAIVPVLLPGADVRALASFDLSLSQALDLRDWPEQRARDHLSQELANIFGRRDGSAHDSSTQAETSPYVGDRAFTEDDARFFFGRDEEIRVMLELLALHDTLLVSGPSQVGKTSLVQAGLVPTLRRLRNEDGGLGFARIEMLNMEVAHPDAAMLASVAEADLLILDAVDSFQSGGEATDRARRLADIGTLLGAMSANCRLIIVARDVLAQSEREAFQALIASRRVGHMRVIPMSGDALLRAIEKPAELAGHLLEPGLAGRLIESAGQARSAVAQVQSVLAVIWQSRKRGWLTNQSLEAAGQFDGILAKDWLAAIEGFKPAEEEAVSTLLMRLVILSGRRELLPAARLWEPLATVPTIAKVDAVALRDRLAAIGLIEISRDSGLEHESSESPGVVVALTRPSTGFWFDAGRTEVDLRHLLWRESLAVQVLRWDKDDTDSLLAGAALTEAEQWLQTRPKWLTAAERDFIQASLQERDRRLTLERYQREREQQEREGRERERREAAEQLAATEVAAKQRAEGDALLLRRREAWLRRFLAATLVLVGAAMGLIGWGLVERAEAKRQQQRAEEQLEAAHESNRNSEVARERLNEALAAANLGAVALDTAIAKTNDEAVRGELQGALDVVKSVVDTDCQNMGTLYLHINDENDRAAAERMKPYFEQGNFTVPGIELVKEVPRANEIRYFRRNELDRASEAVTILQSVGVMNPRVNYLLGQDESVPPCHYEGWFVPTVIRYFRPSDRSLVERVVGSLGVGVSHEQGTSRLVPLAPNTLAYAADISMEDRRRIAVAFIDAGFRLRAMTDAVAVSQERLVQVIASARVENECAVLTIAEVERQVVCGGRSP